MYLWMHVCVISFVLFNVCFQAVLSVYGGMLYPRESETRDLKELGGMWSFIADHSPSRNKGFDEKWYTKPLAQSGDVIPMPVPSSFNDVTQDKKLRDFVGWVWYDREFFVSSDWKNKRLVFRVDSAHYNTKVWINSQLVMEHSGGHLPFKDEINNYVNWTAVNRVTIAVNNPLSPTTLPPGTVEYPSDRNRYPPGYFVQKLQMDFFNYAGIQRPVKLYTTPRSYIDDITVTTQISGFDGLVKYNVTFHTDGSFKPAILVHINEKGGKLVGQDKSSQFHSSNVDSGVMSFVGEIKVSNAHFWWPYTMNKTDTAYLYTFEVIMLAGSSVHDVYRQPFGIREVKVTTQGVNSDKTQFLINNMPFYCHGAAKHEDSDVRD